MKPTTCVNGMGKHDASTLGSKRANFERNGGLIVIYSENRDSLEGTKNAAVGFVYRAGELSHFACGRQRSILLQSKADRVLAKDSNCTGFLRTTSVCGSGSISSVQSASRGVNPDNSRWGGS